MALPQPGGFTFDRAFLKFLGVALLQNIANYGVYLLVLLIAPWWVAFACAMVVGLSIQTVMQIRATFGQKLEWRVSRRYIAYQLGYTAVFATLLGQVIGYGVPAAYAPLLVMVVVTPANFLLSRWIITR
jgi:putative flippase GtrA